METEVIIIGAGVLGVSLAYHLGHRRTRVLLLEREDTPAVHASGKNAGMIRHLYRHPQLTDWAERSVSLWPEPLKAKYFRRTGSLVVGREVPDHHPHLFSSKSYAYQEDGSSDKIPAVHCAADGLLESGGYVNALYSACDRSYVKATFRRRVSAISRLNQRWEVQTEQGDVFHAPLIVNAAGAWLNTFLQPLHPEACVSAHAFARHLCVIHGWAKDYMPAADCGFFWDESRGFYLRLWESDSRLASVCDQLPVADPDCFTPSVETIEHVAMTLLQSFPKTGQTLRAGKNWHCFRTYTGDQMPIWGWDQDVSGLFWLGAFGGFGMSTGFAAALDAAETINGIATASYPDFTPQRTKPFAAL